MRACCVFIRKKKVLYLLIICTVTIATGVVPLQSTAHELKNAQDSPRPERSSTPQFDRPIFQRPMPAEQLAFLNDLAGLPADKAIRNKKLHKLLHEVVPDCVFHYGWDMSLLDALNIVLKGSPLPVQIRQGRYVMVSGLSGPYLQGRGFLWIDMQDGISLGAFYFHPTNGEPAPTVTVFSKQIEEAALDMSQLPPAFAADLRQWSAEAHIPRVTTRYFITGLKEKILLGHDEDYCALTNEATAPPGNVCEQMNAQAADVDLDAAYYLDQTHHATNGTAWMINGADQVAWIQVREVTCRGIPDPLPCHIRLTRERTHVIINRHPRPYSTAHK